MNQITSHRKMGFAAHTFHLTMCCLTMGLWIPMYISGLRRRTTVTKLPPVPAYQQPWSPQQSQYSQAQYPQYQTWR